MKEISGLIVGLIIGLTMFFSLSYFGVQNIIYVIIGTAFVVVGAWTGYILTNERMTKFNRITVVLLGAVVGFSLASVCINYIESEHQKQCKDAGNVTSVTMGCDK